MSQVQRHWLQSILSALMFLLYNWVVFVPGSAPETGERSRFCVYKWVVVFLPGSAPETGEGSRFCVYKWVVVFLPGSAPETGERSSFCVYKWVVVFLPGSAPETGEGSRVEGDHSSTPLLWRTTEEGAGRHKDDVEGEGADHPRTAEEDKGTRGHK